MPECLFSPLPVCVAGLFFVLPCTDSFIKVDMRTISFDIPPQEVRVPFAVNNRGIICESAGQREVAEGRGYSTGLEPVCLHHFLAM